MSTNGDETKVKPSGSFEMEVGVPLESGEIYESLALRSATCIPEEYCPTSHQEFIQNYDKLERMSFTVKEKEVVGNMCEQSEILKPKRGRLSRVNYSTRVIETRSSARAKLNSEACDPENIFPSKQDTVKKATGSRTSKVSPSGRMPLPKSAKKYCRRRKFRVTAKHSKIKKPIVKVVGPNCLSIDGLEVLVDYKNYVKATYFPLVYDDTATVPPPPLPGFDRPCKKEYCRLGCVCNSIEAEEVERTGCGKVDCLFACICKPDQPDESNDCDDGNNVPRLRSRAKRASSSRRRRARKRKSSSRSRESHLKGNPFQTSVGEELITVKNPKIGTDPKVKDELLSSSTNDIISYCALKAKPQWVKVERLDGKILTLGYTAMKKYPEVLTSLPDEDENIIEHYVMLPTLSKDSEWLMCELPNNYEKSGSYVSFHDLAIMVPSRMLAYHKMKAEENNNVRKIQLKHANSMNSLNIYFLPRVGNFVILGPLKKKDFRKPSMTEVPKIAIDSTPSSEFALNNNQDMLGTPFSERIQKTETLDFGRYVGCYSSCTSEEENVIYYKFFGENTD